MSEGEGTARHSSRLEGLTDAPCELRVGSEAGALSSQRDDGSRGSVGRSFHSHSVYILYIYFKFLAILGALEKCVISGPGMYCPFIIT